MNLQLHNPHFHPLNILAIDTSNSIPNKPLHSRPNLLLTVQHVKPFPRPLGI